MMQSDPVGFVEYSRWRDALPPGEIAIFRIPMARFPARRGSASLAARPDTRRDSRPRAKVPDAPGGQHYAVCGICDGLLIMSWPPVGDIRCAPCAAYFARRVALKRQGLRVVA